MNRQRCIFAAVAVSLCTIAAFLDTDCRAADTAGFYQWSALDGNELRGFQVENGSSTIQDQILWLSNLASLNSESSFGNFILEFEYWATSPDSHVRIYLRNPLSIGAGSPHGPYFQLSSPVTPRRSLRRRRAALATAGTWKKVIVQLDGTSASLSLDGNPRCTMPDVASSSGHLAIRFENASGNPTAVRQVRLTELDHRPLFNGVDLRGWAGAGADASQCWKVDQGLLSCTGAKGPWLRTIDSFADFNLRLQYRVKPGGNSGVYVRVPEDGRHHGAGAGIEVQVLDDASPRYAKLKPNQFSAGIYAVIAPQPRVSRPAGEWNSLEINCLGKHYTVIHNGVKVIDASDRDVAELGERRVEGFFGLQNHSEEVWFRDIRIGPALYP